MLRQLPAQVCRGRWDKGMRIDDAEGSAEVQVQEVADVWRYEECRQMRR